MAKRRPSTSLGESAFKRTGEKVKTKKRKWELEKRKRKLEKRQEKDVN